MRPTHYLESLDSVRAPVHRMTDRVPGISQTQIEQAAAARCEALVALAFGRDIVIPQSYALDSFACQDLVRTVVAAEHAARLSSEDLVRPRPVRLHLYNAPRFVDAAASMFSKVNDASWTSSLYPDLSGTDDARDLADTMSKGPAVNPLEWIPDWRSDLFAITWDYFRTAQRGDERRVVEPRPSVGTSLEDGVRRFIARESIHGEPISPASRAAHQLARLVELSPDSRPFQGRSRVHSPEPWTGRAGEASAGDIVDDSVLMNQILEVVDTIYNRTVVDSIGRTFATYSTRVGPWDQVEPEGVIQTQALEEGDVEEVALGGAFEIAFDKPSLDSASEIIPSLLTEAAFAEVLAARESKKWADSLQQLNQAARGSDSDRDRAVHHHTRLMARALDGIARVENSGSGVWIEAKGLTWDVVATGSPALLAAFNPWLGLSASAPAVGARIWKAVQRRRALELRHGALGKLVGPRRNG